MLRNSTSLFVSRTLVPAAAAVSTTTPSFLQLAAAAAATQRRRPVNLAPTWFADNTPAECSSNLKFIAISMRSVEIKSSDLLARQGDKKLIAKSFSASSTNKDGGVVVCEEFDDNRLTNDSNNVVFTQIQINESEATFGDPSGGESLTFTQPIRIKGRGKGQWGSPYFGKIFHQPRNFAYSTSTYWSKKFRMKKHRYTKRWQKRRYKVAALANLPFAKKLRVNMIPKLQQGKGKRNPENSLDLDFTPEQQDLAAQAATGKMTGAVKKRYRFKSKYQQ